MRTPWMTLAAGLLTVAGLPGCARAPEPGPTVADAWVRLPAVPGRPGAGYAKITGSGDHSVMLRGVTSPQAARIELHVTMKMGDKAVSMKPIAEVPVPPTATLFLQPGSAHAMVFGLSPDLKPGGTIPLTFAFDGSTRTVDAKLVGAGDPVPK